MEQGSQVSKHIAPLYGAKGWIKFAGIISIIGGALQVLTIWGILVAWIPIWMGILLVKSSDLIGQAHTTGSEESMLASFQKLATYFKIYGIFILVMIVIGIVGVLAAIMIPALIGLRTAATGGY